MTRSTEDIKKVIGEVIQKQTVVLGPDIAILKARNVSGLKLSDEGKVLEIDGNPKDVLQDLIDEYVSLSGLIIRKTMEPLIKKYPNLSLDAVESGSVKKEKGGES